MKTLLVILLVVGVIIGFRFLRGIFRLLTAPIRWMVKIAVIVIGILLISAIL